MRTGCFRPNQVNQFENIMKMLTQVRIGVAVVAVTMALALPAFAKEEDVKLSDCPAAVQKTIQDNAAGGTIGDIEKETKKDGSVVYEADVKKSDGSKIEIKVAADGKLIKVGKADDDDEDEGKEGKEDKD